MAVFIFKEKKLLTYGHIMLLLCPYMKNKRGQPVKEIKRTVIKLTVLPNVVEDAKIVAEARRTSVSRMVENFLVSEIRRFNQN